MRGEHVGGAGGDDAEGRRLRFGKAVDRLVEGSIASDDGDGVDVAYTVSNSEAGPAPRMTAPSARAGAAPTCSLT